jgi:hypothetical protein
MKTYSGKKEIGFFGKKGTLKFLMTRKEFSLKRWGAILVLMICIVFQVLVHLLKNLLFSVPK